MGNISGETTQKQLADLFCQFGEVESITLLPAKGAALVFLTSVACAIKATYSPQFVVENRRGNTPTRSRHVWHAFPFIGVRIITLARIEFC